MNDFEYLADAVVKLKSLKVIKRDSEIATALNYSKGVISEYLNGKKKVSDEFIAIFKDYYGEHLSKNVPHENIVNEQNEDYLTIRRKLKQGKNNNDGIVYVPISAQAGYSKRYKEPIYLNTLETAYLPGTRYRGGKYRIFEVDGDSMMPTLKDGQRSL